MRRANGETIRGTVNIDPFVGRSSRRWSFGVNWEGRHLSGLVVVYLSEIEKIETGSLVEEVK